MYKNIVFDLGGVVIEYNPKDFLMERFFHERTEKKLYDAVFGSQEWLLLDKGELSWQEASQIFLKRGKSKDVAFEMQGLLDDWTDMLSTRNATVALMRLLRKKGYSMYYLSNISRYALEVLYKKDFWKMFTGGVASCQLQMLKPEMGIYQALLEKYNLVPGETIFTDDSAQNVAAAFEAGITGIHFKNVKSFVKQLADYGIDL